MGTELLSTKCGVGSRSHSRDHMKHGEVVHMRPPGMTSRRGPSTLVLSLFALCNARLSRGAREWRAAGPLQETPPGGLARSALQRRGHARIARPQREPRPGPSGSSTQCSGHTRSPSHDALAEVAGYPLRLVPDTSWRLVRRPSTTVRPRPRLGFARHTVGPQQAASSRVGQDPPPAAPERAAFWCAQPRASRRLPR